MRGNKRKAEEMLLEYQQYYDVEKRELVYGQSETKVIEIQRPAYIENINEIVKEITPNKAKIIFKCFLKFLRTINKQKVTIAPIKRAIVIL